jgi:hypothetical protein
MSMLKINPSILKEAKEMYSSEKERQKESSTAYEEVPAGKYNVEIMDEKEKVYKDDNGTGITFYLEILDGPFKGKKIFKTFAVNHVNSVTAAIGVKELMKWGEKLGLHDEKKWGNPDNFHNKRANVKHFKNKHGFNEVDINKSLTEMDIEVNINESLTEMDIANEQRIPSKNKKGNAPFFDDDIPFL